MKLVCSFVAAALTGAIFLADPVRADWAYNGNPICTAPGWQTIPNLIHDGGDGWFVVWQDERDGTYNVYAQKMTAMGDVLWPVNGVAACTASGDQVFVNAVSDGAGGIIVTWRDGRGADSDVYAQRLDADGNPVWTPDGVAFCEFTGDQVWGDIVADGVGGAVAAWEDFRTYGGGIYAQRIDADGHLLWTTGGVPVCSAAGDQLRPHLMVDDVNSPIVAWYDGRGADYDIYAQRLGWDGSIQWAPDGVPVCTAPGDQEFWTYVYAQVVTDAAGGAILVWHDQRKGHWDTYGQRLDPAGNALWTHDGVVLADGWGDQTRPVVLADGAGGAIACWEDGRGGDLDLFAQRLNPDGTNRWAPGGNPVCTAFYDQTSPRITSDGDGGAIIAWRDFRWNPPMSDIWAQKIDASGAFRWGTDGQPVCQAISVQAPGNVTSDGAGGCIVAWYDYRTYDYDVYANRIVDTPPVPTLLQDFHASAKSSHIAIEWRLYEAGAGMEFVVYRETRTGTGFREIVAPAITGDELTRRFEDHDVVPGQSYRHRVDVSDEDGRRTLFETADIMANAPEMALHQNVPNPFNPSTRIQFYLPNQGTVALDVFDVSGRRVKSLLDGVHPGGLRTVEWDGHDAAGNAVSSGVYLYVLRTGKQTLTRKMVLVR